MKKKEKQSFYITTTIPYVNADPHIGFALELAQADALARARRLSGRDVFFSTGTDEYGQKIWEASEQEGRNVQEYVDHFADKFLELKNTLNLSYDNFIRTTSREHIAAAQEFWRLCDAKGDIYKKVYRGLYCIGCEKFITEKDLLDGKCPLHSNKKPEMVEEENYFFRLKKYQKPLLAYLKKDKVIVPEWRRAEALDFAQNGMEDFSVSRSVKRFSWGIPVPGDETQIMYVWFGAFINYISTLGWPASAKASAGKPGSKENLFEKFWQDGETVQVAGKDMVKFQSVMWQGMLLSAGLPTTDKIIYHGFITNVGGMKMSKSVGNVINPNEIVKKYGTDALRYFLLREISTFEDSPFTMERFKESYNASLANGLGNLTSRILTLSEKYLDRCPKIPAESDFSEYFEFLEKFELKQAVDYVWNEARELDKFIQVAEPFKVVKIDETKGQKIISDLAIRLYRIAEMLDPIMPETSLVLKKLIKENKKPNKPLFPRKD